MRVFLRGLLILLAGCSSTWAQVTFQITTASPLPAGTVGTFYSQQLTATAGFSTPYTWTVPASQLPPGLTLSTSGVLSGTPSGAGSFNPTFNVVTAQGGNGPAARKLIAITINPAPPLKITTPSISNPVVGLTFTQVLSASGGVTPYRWDISSGFLPPGLSLDPVSGTLAGTVSAANTYTFTVRVTDALLTSATQMFTVTATNPINFLTNAVGNGVIGVPYSQQINATGGAPPLTFSLATNPFGTSSLPPGLSLSSTGGITGTPTTAGTYSTITVVVTDTLGNSASKTYSITISSPQAPLVVSPGTLTFTASSAGNSPASQIVTVLSAGATAATFSVTLDGGQANTPAPTWLKVTPLAGITPGLLTASVDPSGLNAGSFSGRIVVGGMPVVVNLTVAAASQQLSVSPGFLRYPARVQSPGLLDRFILVRNAGGSGAASFSVSAPNPISWLDSITPNSGQASPNSPVFVRIRINTTGLAVGGYKGVIRFSSGSSSIDVPISVFVSPAGPILDVDQTGLRFEARQGQGVGSVKTVQVLNDGDPGTTVNFAAGINNSANWLTVSPATGTATTSQPGPLQFSINSNAQSLAPGGYYALVQITDANSHNSPQYVVVVLDVGTGSRAVAPDPSPQGLVFTAGGTQAVTVGVNSSSAVNFTAAAITSDGGTWLSVAPGSGSISSTSSQAHSCHEFDRSQSGSVHGTGERRDRRRGAGCQRHADRSGGDRGVSVMGSARNHCFLHVHAGGADADRTGDEFYRAGGLAGCAVDRHVRRLRQSVGQRVGSRLVHQWRPAAELASKCTGYLFGDLAAG